MEKTKIKSENQTILDLIEKGNVKDIYNSLSVIWKNINIGGSEFGKNSNKMINNTIGEAILELVKVNSNDFTKDIAFKSLEDEYNLSSKQSWCVAYQVVNNINVYKEAHIKSVETFLESLYLNVKSGKEKDESIIGMFNDVEYDDNDISTITIYNLVNN